VTDVKICGLTRAEDVEAACNLGARYLGFNFAKQSPRRVTPKHAAALVRAAATGILRVGVFVDESEDEIRRAIDAASLDLVQLHRPLEEDDLASAARPIIAVAHVGAGSPTVPADSLLTRCVALLFDSAQGNAPGGTGTTFDWTAVAARPWPVPVFLAGGLTAANVGRAIARGRPAAVDVASGVESAPGVKDAERLARFFDAVREADEAHAQTA
jgi:phosphoribosylanthranilate isomerase